MSRRTASKVDDGRALPAVVTTETVLTETSAEVWRRWALDSEHRRVKESMRAKVKSQELANAPIYPRECARRCAEDTQRFARDWRAMRHELGPAFGKLLRQQPELSPEMTQQRRTVLNAIVGSLPRHLQGTAAELHNLIDLLLTAHEAAAYLVGWEAALLDAKTHVDARGRIRRGTRDTGLRLHDGGDTR